MRDLVLILAPVAVVVYFARYPSQLPIFIHWLASWIR